MKGTFFGDKITFRQIYVYFIYKNNQINTNINLFFVCLPYFFETKIDKLKILRSYFSPGSIEDGKYAIRLFLGLPR